MPSRKQSKKQTQRARAAQRGNNQRRSRKQTKQNELRDTAQEEQMG
jgi:hypothetical protein